MKEGHMRVQSRCHSSLVNLILWQITDQDVRLLRCCEIMIRLISHLGLLKVGDGRLKGHLVAMGCCCLRDLAAEDDTVEHTMYASVF